MCTYKQNKTWRQHEILILYWKLQQHKIHAMQKSRNKRVILFYKAVRHIDPQSNWTSFCSFQNWKWQSLSSCAWSVHALIMDTLDTELTKTRKSNVTKLVTTQPTVNLYDPANDRVSNAVSSITSFMSTYSLDGIDIDYQTEMSIEVRIARTCWFALSRDLPGVKKKNCLAHG